MIYTVNDFEIGDLIVNPYDKDQYLEIVEIQPFVEIPFCWCENLKVNTEGRERWKIHIDEIRSKANLMKEARRQKHIKAKYKASRVNFHQETSI